MTDLYAAINGRRVIGADVRLPYAGVWSADLLLDEAGAALAGAVTITLGNLTLKGTVDGDHSGVFAEGRRVRVYGGAGGWGNELPPKPYHNDAGVKASSILQNAAAAAGETLVLATDLDTKIGLDFVRERGEASAVFHHVLPAAVWWVDAAGVTQAAAARPSVELAAGADLELLDFDPLRQVAELAGEPSAVQVGSVLRFPERLAAPLVVRELAYQLADKALRIQAYAVSNEPGGRVLAPLVQLMRRVRDEELAGIYQYRVVEMSVDRAKLQAVARGAWPDLLPCSLGAGMAGAWAKLAPGAVVDVTFENADRTRPLLVTYTPKGRPGHVPLELHLDASDRVRVGEHATAVDLGGASAKVARVDDSVKVHLTIVTTAVAPTAFNVQPTNKLGVPIGPPVTISLGVDATYLIELRGVPEEGSAEVSA